MEKRQKIIFLLGQDYIDNTIDIDNAVFDTFGLYIYQDLYEAIMFLRDDTLPEINQNEFFRTLPVSLFKIVSSLGYIVLMIIIFKELFLDSDLILISIGVILYGIMLFFIFGLLDHANIFSKRYLTIPRFFTDSISYLGFLSLIIFFVQCILG